MDSRGWKTWLIDGFVIVASILLAFAIDAWWQNRVAAEDEAELIGAIIQDVERTQLEIDRVLRRNQMHATAVKVFMDTTPEALNELENGFAANALLGAPTDAKHSSFWVLFALNGITTFTPYLGSMTDTGLSQVSDPATRGAIGNWLVQIADAEENTPGLMERGNALKELASDHGAAQLMAQERGIISSSPPTGGVTHAGVLSSMRDDEELVNRILRYHNQRDNSNRKIERLSAATSELLKVLHQYRAEL